MSNIFFTSDTHFGHARILTIGHGRPWDNIDDHDEQLIENWNSVVGRGDRVYHNGDISFHKSDRTAVILSRLNGQIYVQRGNHDREDVLTRFARDGLIVNWRDIRDLKVDSTSSRQLVVLSHYPMMTWNKAHHGSWMLHGHCHGNLRHAGLTTRIDIGVDVWHYKPVSYEQIKDVMETRTFFPVDHHE